ncbi:hypothetical protein TNCV_2627761 [Trichonephila clavipes]|uniref:Secreted protein n=1 Tax=Trichonephila clavipes TaxID=2585209 RepID=A0A8X6W8J6_TRICX|nr:hypothetical protein TNCV_2627761 [Trichonephila clavipes]
MLLLLFFFLLLCTISRNYGIYDPAFLCDSEYSLCLKVCRYGTEPTCDTSLKNKPGRCLPSDFDDQALLAAVEEDASLTTRMLAEDISVN